MEDKIEEAKEHLKIIERNYTYNNHYSITDLQAIETLLQYIEELEKLQKENKNLKSYLSKQGLVNDYIRFAKKVK